MNHILIKHKNNDSTLKIYSPMAQRNSCLIKLENDSFVAIRKSNLILCNENECAAALINYYEFRHNGKMSELDERVANNRNYKVSEKDYLIQASNQYLMSALLNRFSRNKIIEANALLMSLGYIKIVTDVINPNGGKPVNHIVFNVEYINQRLKQDVEQRLKQDVATSQIGRSQRPKQDVATSQIGRNIDKEKINNIDLNIDKSDPDGVDDGDLHNTDNENPYPLEAEEKKEKSCAKKEKSISSFDEESKSVPIFDNQIDFFKNWEVWLRYKLSIKKQFKTSEAEKIGIKRLHDISRGKTSMAIKIIETSIANGWQGLFEVKETVQEHEKVNLSNRSRFTQETVMDF